jgi:hypothetical protein
MTLRPLAALLVVLAWPLPAASQGMPPRQPLPAFTVTAPDGQTLRGEAMAPADRWLIVYVAPDCQPCASLLKSLADWSSPDLLGRTVLVFAGSRDAASAAAGALPDAIAGLRWFVDDAGHAAGALQLQHAPALLGVREGRLEWKLGGVLNSPGVLQSVVRTWVETPQ